MHSFLLLDHNETALEKKASEICEKYEISPFDKIVIKKEKSIGIEDIRNVQKDLVLTPVKGKMKAAIIYRADSMTPDAQNAFLKTLEEPPPHTILILLGENKESFLPTVLSRCTILQTSASQISENTTSEGMEMLKTITSLTVSEKLHHAEVLSKTRDGAIEWSEKAQLFIRNELIQTPTMHLAKMLRELQQTHRILKQTNAATRVVMEHLFLSLA